MATALHRPGQSWACLPQHSVHTPSTGRRLKLACGQRGKRECPSEITRQSDRDPFPPKFGHSVETDLHKDEQAQHIIRIYE